MLKSLLNALHFLTILKVGRVEGGTFARLGQASWAFPFVGAVIGIILVATRHVLYGVFPPLMLGTILVTLWIFITGGLHVDGWVDCWDSLPAAVSPRDRLVIMKDSRIGTFGAIALVGLFMLKAAALSHNAFPSDMLFVAPIAARTIMIFVAYGSPHKDEGMAGQFIDGLSRRALWGASLATIAPMLYTGILGLAAVVCAYAAAVWFKRFAVKRLTVVTGDVIGGVCELSECVILVVAAFGLQHV